MRRREFLQASLASAALSAVSPLDWALADTGTMRIGYHYWAPAGLMFETLKNTNILQMNGIKAEFPIFSTGGPLAEAAVGGSSDSLVGGDVTVLRGVSRRKGSRVVMRSNDWRWAIVVQPDFKGTTLDDLRGHKLGGSFVAGSFIGALKTLEGAGLNPSRDIQLTNLDLPEAVAALQQKIIDAAVVWDPALEKILAQGNGKVLYMCKPSQALAWQGLTDRFFDKFGEDGATRLCKSWILATWWVSNNADRATAWFAQTSRVDVSVLKAAQSADRYLRSPVKDPATMDFRIAADDIAYAQSIMDFLFQQKLAADTFQVAPLVDMTFMEKAMNEVKAGNLPKLEDIHASA
jgi:ABC-type nitrate/sulfonate/bicarbonate transport system substrate-binding protein